MVHTRLQKRKNDEINQNDTSNLNDSTGNLQVNSEFSNVIITKKKKKKISIYSPR